MNKSVIRTRSSRFARIVAALAAFAAGYASNVANAGECPPDQLMPNALAGAATMPAGVVDTELSSIDLARENVHLDSRRLRLRHMTIEPGGVVPFHSHEDRPALIMVNSGEIHEHSSKCAVPILHKAGDISREFLGTKHWWKNSTAAPVELTIADIVNDGKPATMMEHM